MRLEHSFTVPVPVATAWDVLLDLPRMAPCLPGATLTGVQDDTFTGTVKVRLGPISLTYQGRGRFVERDAVARRVVVEASGRDTRSAGTAAATVTATLVPDGDRSSVQVLTDLTVTGKPAQFGRGMIADVGAKLIGQFADCVASTLGAGPSAPADLTAPVGAAPVGSAAPVGAAPVGSAPVGSGARVGSVAVEPSSGEVNPRPGSVAAGNRASMVDVVTESPAEAEAIDLLRLTGRTEAARRLARYGAGTVLAAGVAWLVLRRLRG